VRFHETLKVDVSVRDWRSRDVVKLELFNLIISASWLRFRRSTDLIARDGE
jgi:hypothetical protein